MIIIADYDNLINDNESSVRRPASFSEAGLSSSNWYTYPQTMLFIALSVVASVLAIAYVVQSNQLKRKRTSTDYEDGEMSTLGTESLSTTNSEMSSSKYDQKLQEMLKFFKGRGLPTPSQPNLYARKLYHVLKKQVPDSPAKASTIVQAN